METLGLIFGVIVALALYLGIFEYFAWRVGVQVAKQIKKTIK